MSISISVSIGARKGTNGVSTMGSQQFSCLLTEGLFGYSR